MQWSERQSSFTSYLYKLFCSKIICSSNVRLTLLDEILISLNFIKELPNYCREKGEQFNLSMQGAPPKNYKIDIGLFFKKVGGL